MTDKKYLFKSDRLGFRNWEMEDIPKMYAINSDPKVMEYFPFIPTYGQTESFVGQMLIQFQKKGFCYFAVETLSVGKFIGFIGLSEKDFKTTFSPFVDIGWRLGKYAWGKGYGTEGAERCLAYAFEELKLEKVMSLAPVVNQKSIHVMEKIGMHKVTTFKHPQLKEDKRLESCFLYQISNKEWKTKLKI
ncbi:GNAT family N-acetyltransferase [Limibacter armeniacum]|uniref:GNAT family N-acetyltransferase n=1 Tax=Limibacter armeniacum TaxID=466084 RepID=UPI002FE5D7E5